MKKYFAFVMVLIEMLVFCSVGVSALDNIRFSLGTDENIKSGQAFNMYISADSNKNIGVFRISVEFDDEVLDFKSAVLTEEYKDNYMKYEKNGNRIIIVYMNDTPYPSNTLKNCIKLRFAPFSPDSENYIIQTSLYEAGDEHANPFECTEMPTLSLIVSENGSYADVSYSDTSYTQQSDVYVSRASALNSDKETENSDITQNSQNTSIPSLPENHEYSLSENESDINFKQDYFYFIAGAIILVAVVAVTAFKLGARNKYSDSDDKNSK